MRTDIAKLKHTWLDKYFKGDRTIWLIVFILSIFSLLAVYSSTGTLAYRFQRGNTEYYLIKHLIILAFGLALMYAAHRVKYTYYSRISQIALWVTVPLLVLTLLLGTNLNEASRWLTLPGTNITFQTSDFAKLALIMYVARMLSKKQDQIKNFKSAFLPVIAPVFLVCALILPANFSTCVVVFLSACYLMFIGRINMKFIVGMVGIGALLFAVFILVSLAVGYTGRIDTWKSRIEHFTGDEPGDNYQAEQAKIAIARGGLVGQFPGNSVQRNFLPHPYSDFIYAIILEEYGLIGGAFILFLYLLLFFRVIKFIHHSPMAFGTLLAAGCTFTLVFQALLNMAVAVNLFPVTGQPLPLVSMGGTSIWFTSISLGIVLSVSRQIEKEKKREAPDLQRRKLRVLISGGGTGGHIFPAIAIANELKEINPANEFLFVGAKGRMEMDKVPAAGYKIEGLDISGIQRKFSMQNFMLPFRIIKSVLRAQKIVKNFSPDVAVGVGGYASGPLLYAASMMNIPALIQEQNSFAGVTNKILAKRVQRVCVAFEGMEKYFPAEKILITGNPVRDNMISIEGKKEEALKFFGLENKPVLLVIGGSLGARTLNESISGGIESLLAKGIQVIWQTGNAFSQTAAEISAAHRGNVYSSSFIQRMDLAYAAADVIVSRAGASSVSELTFIGKPAVLIPSPNVAEDHQTRNAEALVRKQAALLIHDRDARSSLTDIVLRLFADERLRQQLSENIRLLALPGSSRMIAEEVYRLADEKNTQR